LDVSSLGGDAPCLQGLELERAAESGKAVHSLGREVLRGRSVEFVGEKEVASLLKERDEERAANPSGSKKDSTGTAKDPGILVLSEMVFDKSHQFVVLKYLFLCGSRCNSG